MKQYLFIFCFILGLSTLFTSCSDDDTICEESTYYQDLDEDGLGNPSISITACEAPEGYVDNDDDQDDSSISTQIEVNPSYFLTDNGYVTITKVDCNLSDGTSSECYQIVSQNFPEDHEMGPWCPDNIADGADKGGIWLENGEVYDVDGEFIKNMAVFYNDDKWLMYDANGDIYTTETEDDCANAANPNVGEAYANFCVECLPSYITNVTQTYLIPVSPKTVTSPTNFGGGGGGPGGPGGGISQRGLAFNGIVFDAPAPTDAILGAYTLAPFDDAGGHINLTAGYHYHAATGVIRNTFYNDGKDFENI